MKPTKPGQQTITMHILFNMSRRKGNQAMNFGQVIEHNKKIFFFKNHEENQAGKLVADIFLLFKRALCEVKASGLLLSFNIVTGNGFVSFDLL